uniref:Uncharacterized protein n=1 Tax=Oryza meridionalis TaxID=40149 RepID=A0A0E0DGA7_9ORYZ
MFALADDPHPLAPPRCPAKKLDITCCCKELEEKVGVNESPEWNNISHIARVHIGDSYFMDGKKCSEETLDRQQ